MIRPPPIFPLFPSPTLFRSDRPAAAPGPAVSGPAGPTTPGPGPAWRHGQQYGDHATTSRSEEHTSELQSRQYLVCRLLLEKKKKTTPTHALTRTCIIRIITF